MSSPTCWRKADQAMYARKAQRKGSGYRTASIGSRNDVRRELIFDECDPVAQVQFALLQPLDLQQVGARRDL